MGFRATAERSGAVIDYEAMLSPAERRVLLYLLAGDSNHQIAKRVGISDKTVKNHLARILKKTNSATRLEIVVKVYKERVRVLRRRVRERAA